MVLNSWPMNPFGRVGDEPDPAGGPADPDKLVRCLDLVRSEHRTEHGRDDVEARVVEGQGLRVSFDVVGDEALRGWSPPRPVEQRRDVVDTDDRAAAPSHGHRGVAAAGRDIEHVVGRMDVDGFDEELRDEQDLGADHVVVAARPGRLLAGLDGGEIGSGRDDGHGIFPCRCVDTSQAGANGSLMTSCELGIFGRSAPLFHDRSR